MIYKIPKSEKWKDLVNDGSYDQEELDQINRCMRLICDELNHIFPWRRERMAYALIKNEKITGRKPEDDVSLAHIERAIKNAGLKVPSKS